MGKQRKKTNERNRGTFKELNEIKTSNLSTIEFQIMVIRLQKELSENYKELSRNYMSMKKDTETLNKTIWK